MADQPSSETSVGSTTPSSDQLQLPGSSPSPVPGSAPEPTLTRNTSLSKLNARAPEFVPSTVPPRVTISPSPAPPPPIGVVYAPAAANQAFHVPMHVAPVQQHTVQYNHHQSPPRHNHHPHHQHRHHQKKNNHHEISGGAQNEKDHAETGFRNGLSEEANQKIINQVEFYFSDVNLSTTDHLIKFINKDPEGYVPISVVASFKKIKALISSNSQLAAVLRNSSKLVVSEDGKKIKRLHPLTGPDMEELQCRIIIAENLPEDHCYQNLMKVFSSVGSVKSIRTCQPSASNTNSGTTSASRSSKSDNLHHSVKVHAFVEYDSVELAEKAVAELNDGNDWRNGLRVRLLFKRTAKRGKKVGIEGEVTAGDDDDTSTYLNNQDEKQAEGPSALSDHEHLGEEPAFDKDGGQKKSRNRGRGKGRGRGHQNSRSNHVGPLPASNPISNEHPMVGKPPPGPRMPDGTRGFSMGRGKPVAVDSAE